MLDIFICVVTTIKVNLLEKLSKEIPLLLVYFFSDTCVTEYSVALTSLFDDSYSKTRLILFTHYLHFTYSFSFANLIPIDKIDESKIS